MTLSSFLSISSLRPASGYHGSKISTFVSTSVTPAGNLHGFSDVVLPKYLIYLFIFYISCLLTLQPLCLLQKCGYKFSTFEHVYIRRWFDISLKKISLHPKCFFSKSFQKIFGNIKTWWFICFIECVIVSLKSNTFISQILNFFFISKRNLYLYQTQVTSSLQYSLYFVWKEWWFLCLLQSGVGWKSKLPWHLHNETDVSK